MQVGELPSNIDDNSNIIYYSNDTYVILKIKVKAHRSYALNEDFFDISFANQLSVERIVEYCQWKEINETNVLKYEKNWFNTT